MEKMKFKTKDLTDENVKKIGELFPEVITEGKVDFDKLKQVLSKDIVEGDECYDFTWVGKKEATREANRPTTKTLRPCKKESVNFDTTENLYIEGDNLEVLKILQESYLGKIKMIYIDPPYNTGNDFIYNDDFKMNNEEYAEETGEVDEEGNRLFRNTDSNGRFHSDWCSMMYSRLKLARNLLSDDGVIFISIDDNEVDNLRKICDDVFGYQNFIGMLSVENNPKGRKNSDFISVSSEYCIIFAKNKLSTYFIENIPKKAGDMTLDENGQYVHNSGKRVLVGENSFNNVVIDELSDKNYSVYYNSKYNQIKILKEKYGELQKSLIKKGYEKYWSYHNRQLVENTYTDSKLLQLFENNALQFLNGKIYEKNFSDTVRIKSQLVNREYDAIIRGEKKKYSMELTTTGAGTYLKELFGLKEVPFSAPKNIGFLKILVSLIDDKNFVALDFFSGSASFADAIIKQNYLDGGNRKFIMVQLPEECAKDSEAYKAGYKNICEIGKERIRRAGKQILKDMKDSKTPIEKMADGEKKNLI